MVFLIDFENVSNSGFEGLDSLQSSDRLIIFYTEHSKSISMATHCKLEESGVQKQYIQVQNGGKNALDFQLVSYLGYLVATEPDEAFCIVSNDTGYQFVTDFWKERGAKVMRCRNLQQKTEESEHQELLELLPEEQEEIGRISRIIEKYKTKQGVNNALVKLYGSDRAGGIYKTIRPLIKNKKGH